MTIMRGERIDYLTNNHLGSLVMEVGDRVSAQTRWVGPRTGELLDLDNTRGKCGLLYALVRFDDGPEEWYLAQHLWPAAA
jgi:hypothetical protein